MSRPRVEDDEDELPATCAWCRADLEGRRVVRYTGPNASMGRTYCSTDCLLDDLDRHEGRVPPPRRP